MKISLPGLSTVGKWASKLSFQPGTQYTALELMKNKGKELTESEKIV